MTGRFAVTSLAVLALGCAAQSTTNDVNDDANVMSATDIETLLQHTFPFETQIFTMADSTSRSAMEALADRQIGDLPNVVVIVVEPTSRRTVIRASGALDIEHERFDGIAQAGDDSFRAHDFRSGFEAIMTAAAASTHTGRAHDEAIERWLVLAGVVALAVFLLWRHRRSGGSDGSGGSSSGGDGSDFYDGGGSGDSGGSDGGGSSW